MSRQPEGLSLGLGLIGIGRPWPHDQAQVPDEAAVATLIRSAIDLGVVFFDTASAYGLSEQRLGAVLTDLPAATRDRLTIATKFGEFWHDPEFGTGANHDPAALRASLRCSIERLGRIDILQVHKATAELISNPAFLTFVQQLAEEHGIPQLGISARDEATCQAAVESGMFTHVQCPLNASDTSLLSWIQRNQHHITVLVNRPLGSGQLGDGADRAYEFLAAELDTAVILTGTRNVRHLEQSVTALRTCIDRHGSGLAPYTT